MKTILKTLAALAGILILISCVCAFAMALISAIIPAFRSDASVHSGTTEALSILKITLFTLTQALLSLFIALLVGFPAAYFTANRKFPLRKFLTASSVIPLCLPPLIMALAYISTFGMSGFVNTFLKKIISTDEPPVKFLYSFRGIIIVQGFYNFPLVMSTVGTAWKNLDTREKESAELLGAGKLRIFFTITFWQLLPSAGAASIPVFLFCFFSFIIVMLFGAPGTATLETAIYHAGRSVLNFKGAALLALTETLVAFCILFLYSVAEKKSDRSTNISCTSELSQEEKLGTKDILPFSVFILLAVLFFYAPLASIFIKAKDGFIPLFKMKAFLPSVYGTITTGILTGILSTSAAFTYSVLLRFRKKENSNIFLKTIPLLPMAVSSVVMGIGIVHLVKHGTFLHLVLAQSALIWPFAFRQLNAKVSRIPEQTLDAARTLSENPLDTVFYVIIPLCKKNIMSTLALTFALSAGDTALPLVLSVPGYNSLSLFTYRLAGSYRFSEACAAGLILALLCTGMFISGKENGISRN